MRILTATFLILFISACTSIDIDRKAKGFDEEQYLQHLTECHEENNDLGDLLGHAAIGGLIGVLEGLTYGSLGMIGAVVGGTVLGLVTGIFGSSEERNNALVNCMIGKGYKVY